MSLRSDLGRVRGLGAAGSGTAHWWHQRVSAVASAVLGVWFAFTILGHLDDGYAEIVGWIGSPFVTVALIALVLAVFYHAALGLQVVIEDYVHGELGKIVLLIAMKLAAAFGALAGVVAILKISFAPA